MFERSCLTLAAFVSVGCGDTQPTRTPQPPDSEPAPEQDPEPAWIWANKGGGPGADLASDLSVDPDGNLLVAGWFEGGATFEATTLAGVGGSDAFVAKYDTAGVLLWVVSAGGTDSDVAESVTSDPAGNVLVTGTTRGEISFGGTLLGGDEPSMFLAKYSSDSSLLWARSAEGADASWGGMGVAADRDGNVLVIGTHAGDALFGDITLPRIGQTDVFVARYDPAGDVTWVRSAGGTSADFGLDIALDGAGNAYVSGGFSGLAQFGEHTLSAVGSFNDIFVAKLTPDGEFSWARRAGADAFNHGNAIAADAAGQVYVTGSFAGTTAFDPVQLKGSKGNDAFVAKYGTTGDLLWVAQGGGADFDYGYGLAVSSSTGDVCATGTFVDTATFEGQVLTGVRGDNAFFACYHEDGEFSLARSVATSSEGTSNGTGIAFEDDQLFLCGQFSGEALFGSVPLEATQNDLYVVMVSL